MRSERKNTVKQIVQEEPRSLSAEVVGCSRLNVRSEPSPIAKIIDVLNAGTLVCVNLTATFDKYYEILAPSGKKGYAMKEYLKLIK